MKLKLLAAWLGDFPNLEATGLQCLIVPPRFFPRRKTFIKALIQWRKACPWRFETCASKARVCSLPGICQQFARKMVRNITVLLISSIFVYQRRKFEDLESSVAEAAEHNIITDDVKKAEGGRRTTFQWCSYGVAICQDQVSLDVVGCRWMSVYQGSPSPCCARCRCHHERITWKAGSSKHFWRSGSFAGRHI